MYFKLTFALASVCVSFFLTGCNSGSSADRKGAVLGNINKMKSVYVVNQTKINDARAILGTPNYETKLKNGDSLYVYTFKVNYPFEGLSSIGFINNMKEKPSALNKEQFKTLPSTSKVLTIESDNTGKIVKDYTFGLKYVSSLHIEDSNDTYCLTYLSDKELENNVNFSLLEIESIYSKEEAPTTYINALIKKLSAQFGEITTLEPVKKIETDGKDISKRPSILFNSFCNEITCNKKFDEF